MGAWIETTIPSTIVELSFVAPRVGAWIETGGTLTKKDLEKSAAQLIGDGKNQPDLMAVERPPIFRLKLRKMPRARSGAGPCISFG